MDKSENIESAVAHFVDVARRYCAWAEGKPGELLSEMQRAQKFLAELHLAVIDLPEAEPEEDVKAERSSAAQFKAICQRFAELPVYGYWEVFNPLKQEEPVFQTLADDLADIHSDVKRGLLLFDAGHIGAAVWEWRLHFKIQWGEHLTGAQRAIYSYLVDAQL